MSRTLLAAVIWLLFGLVCLISDYAHAGDGRQHDVKLAQKASSEYRYRNDANELGATSSGRQLPPGLQRVMAEGAGRVANMTCADVRAVVAVYGAWKAEAVARASGASEAQIARAKSCLNSSSR